MIGDALFMVVTQDRVKRLTVCRDAAEVTRLGLNTLRRALPRVIAIQSQIFGQAGRLGGALLEGLIKLYNNLPEEAG
jgi:hypothetical protein